MPTNIPKNIQEGIQKDLINPHINKNLTLEGNIQYVSQAIIQKHTKEYLKSIQILIEAIPAITTFEEAQNAISELITFTIKEVLTPPQPLKSDAAE